MKKFENTAYREGLRFFARIKAVKRGFDSALYHDRETIIFSEHTEEFRNAIREAAKEILRSDALIFIDGGPRLFTFARTYLQKIQGDILEKTLKSELYEWDISGFGDTELSLLQAFFVIV